MSSIRKFAYAALLALATLTFVPSRAVAQEAVRGSFALTHDVLWESAVVPAGNYRFSYSSSGIGGILTLRKVDGAGMSFMFLANGAETSKPTDISQLVLEPTSDGSYVSALQLPEFGLTLNFHAPSKGAEKQLARATTTAQASAR